MKIVKGTGASFEIIGRLKEVPELLEVSERKVTNITLAVDERRYVDNEKLEDYTEWHRISVWGSAAEFVCKHTHPGMRLKISATVKNKRRENLQTADGNSQVIYVPTFSTNIVEAMDAIKSSEDVKEVTATETEDVAF